jgi:hypothetical protein
MTMFDSPLEFCSVIKEYVALDQTPRDCRIQHRCEAARCPLESLFPGNEAADSQKALVAAESVA